MQLKELRQQVWEANLELPKRGLVLYTFGNVSGIDRDRGIMAIKPSGVDYEDLTPEMIVLLDMDGKRVEGNLNPSSDTATHLVLYHAFQSIGGVTHTHSSNATAWAQARLSIPCYGTTHADYAWGAVPCTLPLTADDIRGNYEEATGRRIVETFKNISPAAIPMVLVAGHGPFTWGVSPAQAVYHSAVLEELAKTSLATRLINPDAPPLEQALMDRHYQRKHGANATYGQKG